MAHTCNHDTSEAKTARSQFTPSLEHGETGAGQTVKEQEPRVAKSCISGTEQKITYATLNLQNDSQDLPRKLQDPPVYR